MICIFNFLYPSTFTYFVGNSIFSNSKNVENTLRIDKVIAMGLAYYFLEHSVYAYLLYHFLDVTIYWWKIPFLSTRVLFEALTFMV